MTEQNELHYSSNSIVILGVNDVVSFGEQELVLALDNTTLKITGQGFKLIEADMDKHLLKASGKISSLNYGGGAKEGFIKKLFK